MLEIDRPGRVRGDGSEELHVPEAVAAAAAVAAAGDRVLQRREVQLRWAHVLDEEAGVVRALLAPSNIIIIIQ